MLGWCVFGSLNKVWLISMGLQAQKQQQHKRTQQKQQKIPSEVKGL